MRTTMGSAALAAALLASLCACGGGTNGKTGDKSAVEKAAQEQADRFSSADYGGAYDMWVDSAKRLMTRDDYIKFAKTCDLGGVPLEAHFVRFEGDKKTAVVRIGLGDITQSYTMKLEDGDWSWVPTDKAQSEYRLGVAGAVAAAKKDGSCNAD